MSASPLQRLRMGAVLLLGAMLSGPAPAAEFYNGDLQLHGFLAQGLVRSTGNNVDGGSRYPPGSFLLHELGANVSWRPRGDLLLSAQAASVKAGAATDKELALEYAVIDYAPIQNEIGRAGLRLGKLKLPIGLYNDSRDNVFTRPSILLPQGIYLDNSGARAFGYFSLYGGELYSDWYLGKHALYLEEGGFVPQDLDPTAAIAILRTPASGRFGFDHGALLRLIDDYDGGRLRGALSMSTVTVHYHPGDAPPFLLPGDLHFDQYAASLQYNAQKLSLTGEYLIRDFKLDRLVPGPLGSSTHLHPGGFYLQGQYHFTSRLQGLLRYDEQRRNMGDPSGRNQAAESAALSAASRGAVPALPRYYFFGRDWTVGGRYDLRPDLALWTEYHNVDGVSWVNPLDNPGFNGGGAQRHWNLYLLMLAYRF